VCTANVTISGGAASGVLVAALQVGRVVQARVQHRAAALLVVWAHTAGAALLARLCACAQIGVIIPAATLRALRAAEVSTAGARPSAAALTLWAHQRAPVVTAAAICDIWVDAVLVTGCHAAAMRRCAVAAHIPPPSDPTLISSSMWVAVILAH